jgi:hypothetical protein
MNFRYSLRSHRKPVKVKKGMWRLTVNSTGYISVNFFYLYAHDYSAII